ncbi:MAG: hypothetical protein M0R37_12125 [Bacteroidales bacterium]|jgi:hypothetical protein|nr:hypothetical protein [Sphaerochaeta sp.]MCK9629322.1 hypothetical protein [Bacteroidales bacterium]
MKPKALWCASLSDGTTHYEGKGDFAAIPGEQSPFLRLLSLIASKNLAITSLSLYSDDGRHWALPSAGHNPKFRAFDSARKPCRYSFFRKVRRVAMGRGTGQEDRFAVIEAEYGDGTRLQLWVEDGTLNCWTLPA